MSLSCAFYPPVLLIPGGRFPEYKTNDNRFSIWAESYGGHYGPTFASYFEAQNQLIAAGNISSPAVELHIDTLGLINACIDSGIQTATYPVFAFNNTYGFQGINETEYQTAVAAIPKCQNLTETCRTVADNLDPEGWGNNQQVNAACAAAFQFCFGQLWNPFNAKGVSLSLSLSISANTTGSNSPTMFSTMSSISSGPNLTRSLQNLLRDTLTRGRCSVRWECL